MRRRHTFSSLRPYDLLHSEIRAHQGGKKSLLLAIAFGIAALIYTWVKNAAKYSVPTLFILSLLVGLAIAVIWMLLFLAFANITRMDDEQKLISAALAFLHKQHYTDAILDTLDRRAEVGANSGQLRTLFPILAIPIVILLLSEYIGELINSVFLIYLVIFIPILAFSLMRELARANVDIIIRHAIAEYRLVWQQRKVAEHQQITQATQLLQRYLSESDLNK